MKKTCYAVLFFCLFLSSKSVFAKDSVKSPDGKKSVTYDCHIQNKKMTCDLTLIEGKKKTSVHKMNFSSSTIRELGYETEIIHFCKVVWGPDNKKFVFYCYYQSNFETSIYSDDNSFLYLYTIDSKNGNKKTELRKGGSKSDWILIKINTPNDRCVGERSVSWGSRKEDVFLKFDGKKITYHLMIRGESGYDKGYALCEKFRCDEPNEYGCGGPATSIVSVISQGTDKKIISKSDNCYMYYVCD
uniref:Uncharacterized protein n=1 Tax=candidate division CPR3 bacterium TaxID=2268181 RepID=A0A7C4M2I9_UNCC3